MCGTINLLRLAPFVALFKPLLDGYRRLFSGRMVDAFLACFLLRKLCSDETKKMEERVSVVVRVGEVNVCLWLTGANALFVSAVGDNGNTAAATLKLQQPVEEQVFFLIIL